MKTPRASEDAWGVFVHSDVTSLWNRYIIFDRSAMITRDEFPYLQELIINDAYAIKNLRVPVFEVGKPFKHLILTGKNGSGKTTVLREIYKVINGGMHLLNASKLYHKGNSSSISDEFNSHRNNNKISACLYSLVDINYVDNINNLMNSSVILFFEAQRKISVQRVETVMLQDNLEKEISKYNDIYNNNGDMINTSYNDLFKQYLVNKKVFQVFDKLEGKGDLARHQEQFFTKFENILAKIFEDSETKLEFVRENFEFYINLSDGRRFTFNQLSAGFSAFLSILTELLMRTDLLRKQANDYTYDPCGFVLIDEPETHLHLEMQYQILPLLTNLFPNLQFIVATHSPAVASSIKNATVFDLSTGEAMGDEAAGSSFSELMQTHFGVENEYSNVGDAILDDIKEIVKIADHAVAREKLVQLLEEKGKYMSDGLKLEVEAQLIGLE